MNTIMKKQSFMIFLLFIGYVIVYIDKTVTGFALLSIEKEFGLSTEQLGYITGIFFLSYSLFQIPAGWLNDRFGYKIMLFVSLAGLGIFAFLFGMLGFSFALLLVFRFLSGVSHSGYPCSCAKAVVSNFSLETRTFAQSILLSSAGLAMTIGPIIAVASLKHFGWHASFAGLGVIAIVIAILIALKIPNQHSKEENTQKSNSSQLWKNPTVILLFIAIFCVNIPNYGLLAWLPKYFVQSRGMSLEQSGFIIAAGGVGLWISSLCTGWCVGKYFQGKEPIVILVTAIISSIAIFAVYHTTSALTSTILLFIGEVFLMSTFVTIFTLPMKRLPENIMGAAIGLINTGGTLGGFVSPIVIGYLVGATESYASAFVFLSLALICSGLAVLPMIKQKTVQFNSES